MIKLITIIISLGLSIYTTSLFNIDNIGLNILVIIGMLIAYIVACVILFFITAFLHTFFISKKSKKEKYSHFYHGVYTRYVACALSLFGVKLKVNGLDKVPHDKKYLVVQNHVSNLDPMILNNVLKMDDMIFVSKASLFNIPFFGRMIHKIGYAKLYRNNSREDAYEMIRATKWLGEGRCSVAVYPEGKRNKGWRENKLQEFRPGCFSVATKNKAPIVITTITGTEHINEGLLVKIHRITINVVDVLYYEDYKDMNTTEIASLVYDKMYNDFEYTK